MRVINVMLLLVLVLLAGIAVLLLKFQSQHRFQQTPSRYLMFDSKTAQDCYAGPQLSVGYQMPDDLSGALPYCAELVENPVVKKW
jgi:hypothetical protein